MAQKTIKMEVSEQGPARILILPKGSSPDARICTLAHPRLLTPARYYFCPRLGLYEFTRISASKGGCNSWLIARQTTLICDGERRIPVSNKVENLPSNLATDNIDGQKAMADGYIVGSPELFIATPIDPLFFVIPSFLTTHSSAKQTPQLNSLFLSSEDLLDSLLAKSKHLEYIIAHQYFRRRMEQRMSCVCDMVEAGDEKMYRLNLDKLLKELRSKANRILAMGLPASMEEKFIQKALEAPVIGVKRMESSFLKKGEKEFQDEINTSNPIRSVAASSESSSTNTGTPVSAASTGTEGSEKEPIDDIPRLLRLRTILSFIISTYLPPVLAQTLTSGLSSSSTKNSLNEFTLLDEHLAHLESLKVKALASRPISDFSRKRGLEDDDGDEAAEIRAEKKRKKEEEDKRNKAGESRGVKDLKKVDVSGMKKMSAFFKGEGKKNSK